MGIISRIRARMWRNRREEFGRCPECGGPVMDPYDSSLWACCSVRCVEKWWARWT